MPHVEYLISKVSVSEAGSDNGSSISHNGNLRPRKLQSAVLSNGKPHSLPQESTSSNNVRCFKMDKLGIELYHLFACGRTETYGNI